MPAVPRGVAVPLEPGPQRVRLGLLPRGEQRDGDQDGTGSPTESANAVRLDELDVQSQPVSP